MKNNNIREKYNFWKLKNNIMPMNCLLKETKFMPSTIIYGSIPEEKHDFDSEDDMIENIIDHIKNERIVLVDHILYVENKYEPCFFGKIIRKEDLEKNYRFNEVFSPTKTQKRHTNHIINMIRKYFFEY